MVHHSKLQPVEQVATRAHQMHTSAASKQVAERAEQAEERVLVMARRRRRAARPAPTILPRGSVWMSTPFAHEEPDIERVMAPSRAQSSAISRALDGPAVTIDGRATRLRDLASSVTTVICTKDPLGEEQWKHCEQELRGSPIGSAAFDAVCDRAAKNGDGNVDWMLAPPLHFNPANAVAKRRRRQMGATRSLARACIKKAADEEASLPPYPLPQVI